MKIPSPNYEAFLPPELAAKFRAMDDAHRENMRAYTFPKMASQDLTDYEAKCRFYTALHCLELSQVSPAELKAYVGQLAKTTILPTPIEAWLQPAQQQAQPASKSTVEAQQG